MTMENKRLLLPTHQASHLPAKHQFTLRRWRRSRLHTPFSLRHATRGLSLVPLLLLAIVACSFFSLFSSVIPPVATTTKNIATDFGLLFGADYDINGTAWSGMLPSPQGSWSLEANGELGSGKEGWAGLALDESTGDRIVVKQIRRHGSVERNQVPVAIKRWLGMSEDAPMTWPTEIPATLLLSRLSSAISTAGGSELMPLLGYYFLASQASARHGSEPTWHLVTPYMEHGSVASFGKSLQHDNSSLSIRQLDSRYRPVLEKLLLSLAVLGDNHICHDDVKTSNLFVSKDGSWHLGDFGQVREASLSYHTSRFWINGRQLADCTHNDLRRALASYLVFLREASSPRYKTLFDKDFFAAKQPWSRLYWDFIDAPRSGHELVALSRAVPPHASWHVASKSRAPGLVPARLLGHRWMLRHAALWELSCKIANPWDLVGPRRWLFWGWGGARRV